LDPADLRGPEGEGKGKGTVPRSGLIPTKVKRKAHKQGEAGMRSNLKLAALALAVVFAGATTAQGFVLEKAAGAKWRADIVKRQNAFTACVLKAWTSCEAAANAAFVKGTCPGCAGAAADCDTIAGTSLLPTEVKFAPALAKCDLILDGLAKQNTKAPQLRLRDIGCLGDCNTAIDGPQACGGATPDAENAAFIAASKDPAGNIRDTVAAFGPLGNILCVLAPSNTAEVGAAQATLLLNATAKYIPAAAGCVQKCQEDISATAKAGGGFRNDGAACLVNTAGDGALVGAGPLDTCLSKAYAGSLGKLAATTCSFGTPSPILGGATGAQFLMPLLTGLSNSATNSAYDRIDYQALFAGVTPPGQHTAFADRSPAAVPAEGWQRYAFGTCASCGNGVLEDYEECDSGVGNNSLCGTPAVPGSIAGACPTVDNPTAGVAACRCPRP
jgi:hypothetical protein